MDYRISALSIFIRSFNLSLLRKKLYIEINYKNETKKLMLRLCNFSKNFRNFKDLTKKDQEGNGLMKNMCTRKQAIGAFSC